MATYLVVDVSKFQTFSNYADAARSVDGVIIRIGYRGYAASGTCVKDSKFDTHYNGFKGKTAKNGKPIKIGYYWFPTAITDAESIEEANFCAQVLSGHQCDMPIYYDSEYANGGQGRSDGLSLAARNRMCQIWGQRMVELGYRVGLYASQAWFGSRIDYTSFKNNGWSMWIAKYSSSPPTWSGYDAWQYTSNGQIGGISARVDLNNFYKDVAGWSGGEDEKIDINTKNISINPTSFKYTGYALHPTPTIEGLTYSTDYYVTYENDINVNYGEGKVNFFGTGKYKGSAVRKYAIDTRPIVQTPPYLPTSSFQYTGGEIRPKVEFMVNAECALPTAADYTLSYSNNVNVGTGTVLVSARNNFDGYATLNFSITKADISNKNIYPLVSSYEYTGQPINAQLFLDGLVEGQTCTITYSDNINIGTAKATVTGIGNYQGTKTVTYEITKKSMPTDGWALSQTEYVYDGTSHTPTVSRAGMLENVDYTVTYDNTVNAGTATANIVGMGIYKSDTTIKLNYTVKQAPMDMSTFSLLKTEFKYTGQPITTRVETYGPYIYNQDYTYTFSNNILVGTGYCSIRAMGNYTGSKVLEFAILSVDLEREGEITCGEPDEDGIYDNDNFAVYANDIKLTPYKDFVYDFETIRYPVNSSYTYTVWIVTGIANYKGQIQKKFLTTVDGLIPDVPHYVPKAKSGDNVVLLSASSVLDDEISIPEEEETSENEESTDLGSIIANAANVVKSVANSVSEYNPQDIDPVIPVDPTNTDEVKVIYPSGTAIYLNDVAYYSSPYNLYPEPELLKDGYYYIYNYMIVNNRIRVTNKESDVNVAGKCVGWIKLSDISNEKGIKIGDKVIINDYIYVDPYDDSKGKINKAGAEMYIVTIATTASWELGCIDEPNLVVDETEGYDFEDIDESQPEPEPEPEDPDDEEVLPEDDTTDDDNESVEEDNTDTTDDDSSGEETEPSEDPDPEPTPDPDPEPEPEPEIDYDFNELSNDIIQNIGHLIGVANLKNQEVIGWVGLDMFELA